MKSKVEFYLGSINILKLIVLIQILAPHHQLIAQICIPTFLTVNTEQLNFRPSPSIHNTPIDTLQRGDKLELIKVVPKEHQSAYTNYYDSWLLVKREEINDTGYVKRRYVIGQEMAYVPFHDTETIQLGNWYSIVDSQSNLYLKKVIPRITFSLDGYPSIEFQKSEKLFICTQDSLVEGKLTGKFYKKKYLKIGDKQFLCKMNGKRFSLAILGTVGLHHGQMTRENEKLIFESEIKHQGKLKYSSIDISKHILKYGEVGYQLHFAGDINRDGIPEFILSEGDTRVGTYYYFKSNKNESIEFQSCTYVTSKC